MGCVRAQLHEQGHAMRYGLVFAAMFLALGSAPQAWQEALGILRVAHERRIVLQAREYAALLNLLGMRGRCGALGELALLPSLSPWSGRWVVSDGR